MEKVDRDAVIIAGGIAAGIVVAYAIVKTATGNPPPPPPPECTANSDCPTGKECVDSKCKDIIIPPPPVTEDAKINFIVTAAGNPVKVAITMDSTSPDINPPKFLQVTTGSDGKATMTIPKEWLPLDALFQAYWSSDPKAGSDYTYKEKTTIHTGDNLIKNIALVYHAPPPSTYSIDAVILGPDGQPASGVTVDVATDPQQPSNETPPSIVSGTNGVASLQGVWKWNTSFTVTLFAHAIINGVKYSGEAQQLVNESNYHKVTIQLQPA